MDVFSVANSGLQAMGTGLALSSGNVANLNTQDYRARRADLEERREGGVEVAGVSESQEPPTPQGSNVDLATELTGTMLQSNTYQANLKVIQAEDQTLGKALDMKA